MKSVLSLTIVIMVLSCASLVAQKQESSKGSIALSVTALGDNDVINWAGADLVGAAGYSGKSFYTIGLSYIHPLNRWLSLESGVEFSEHTITVHPNRPPQMTNDPYDKELSLITIPITARINFLNYFFVNGGLLIGTNAGTSSPIDSQSGIGTILGVGAKYSMTGGLGAFVNGYVKMHSLIPFMTESNEYRQRLLESGLRIGLTYSF